MQTDHQLIAQHIRTNLRKVYELNEDERIVDLLFHIDSLAREIEGNINEDAAIWQ